jgi:hypothetical protein
MFPRSNGHHSGGSDGHHSSGGSGGHHLFYVPLDLTAIIPEVWRPPLKWRFRRPPFILCSPRSDGHHSGGSGGHHSSGGSGGHHLFYVPLDLTAIIPEVLTATTQVAVQAATIYFMFPRSDGHHSGGSDGNHSSGGSGGHHFFIFPRSDGHHSGGSGGHLVAAQAATIYFMLSRSDGHHSGGSGGHHSSDGQGGHHLFYVA